MLDTDLAHRRHFPAINWSQSFSLYEKDVTAYCNKEISPRWEEVKKECQSLLKQEERLREVAEIVGAEGLQDSDRLLMYVAEQIRSRFLCQNSYTDDAFSEPEKTFKLIEKFVGMYNEWLGRIEQGESLTEILQEIES